MNNASLIALKAILYGGVVGYGVFFVLFQWDIYVLLLNFGDYLQIRYAHVTSYFLVCLSIFGFLNKKHGYIYLANSIFISIISMYFYYSIDKKGLNFEEVVFFNRYEKLIVIYLFAVIVTGVVMILERGSKKLSEN